MIKPNYLPRLALIALLACVLSGCGGDDDSPPPKTGLMTYDLFNYRHSVDDGPGHWQGRVARSVLEELTKAGIRASISGCVFIHAAVGTNPLVLLEVHEADVDKASALKLGDFGIPPLLRDDLFFDPGPPKQVKSKYENSNPNVLGSNRVDYYPCEDGPPKPNNP